MGCGEWFRGFVVFEEILSKKCERNLDFDFDFCKSGRGL